MGGGKETPRQKMVGLMYLVLMALLAMNVSKSVLNSFIIIDNGLAHTNEAFSYKNSQTYEKFSKAAMADKRATKWKTKALKVQVAAQKVYDYIHELKDEVVAHTDGVPVEVAKAYHVPDEDGVVGMWRAQQKDNYDIPSHFLIGDLDNRSQEMYSAFTLVNEIKAYRKVLWEVLTDDKGKMDTAHMHIGVEDLDKIVMSEAEVAEDWAFRNFDHLPLVAVVCNLTKMQSDVRNMEADVIKKLYSHIGADDFKFDTLAVKCIANTNYLILGDTYRAEVIVAAFSTTVNPILEVGHEFDTLGNIIGEKDTAGITVAGGVASYKSSPKTQGPVEWGGRIGIKKPGHPKNEEEDYAWYPFQQSFMVAKPGLVVSPTAMNVFYRGLDNPVEISVAGIPTDKLQIAISNATKSGSKGKFDVKPGKGKECVVSVSAEIGGKKQNFGKATFRCKNVPNPTAYFAGSTGGNVKKSDILAAQGVLAKMENFEFDLKFRVQSYVMSATIKGKVVEQVGSGAKVTGDMKSLIKALKSGQKLYIEKVKAKGPDGSIRDLGSIAIVVI